MRRRAPGGRLAPRALALARSPLARLAGVVALAALVGALLGEAALAAGPGDRVVIGRTGDTLSVLVDAAGARIVIGGGNSRADLADLVGRSTLPWDRQVDLLVVPAWDERHVAGALGLVERGDVHGVAVLGLEDRGAAWTALQRAADETGTRVRYLDGRQALHAAPGLDLDFDVGAGDGPRAGLTAGVTFGGVRVAVIDAPAGARARWPSGPTRQERARVLVSLRALPEGGASGTLLAVRPAGERSSQLVAAGASYVAEVARGRRLTLRLGPDGVRLPLGAVTPAATPQPPSGGDGRPPIVAGTRHPATGASPSPASLAGRRTLS